MKNFIQSFLLTFLVFTTNIYSSIGQVAEWIVPNAGMGVDVCMDQFNNSFTCGQFVGTTTIGSYTFVSAGSQDVVVLKYDPSGNLLWATDFGGTSADYSNKITYDGLGGIWITGQFSGTMTAGSFTLVSAGGTDVYLIKLNAATGAIVYAQKCGNASNDVGVSVMADPLGNIYLAGTFNSSFSFGSVSIAGLGTYEVFLVKLTNAGVPIWASGITGTSIETMWSLTVDNQGNSYIAGHLSSASVSFAGTTQNFTGQTKYITKFDDLGNNVWVSTATFTGEIDAICTDVSGNVYFTGNYDSQAVFGSTTLTSEGLDDILLGKLDNTGTLNWVTSFGGAGNDEGYGITCTPQGNIFVVGTFLGIFNFGSTPFNAGSFNKSFIAKVNTSGTVVWAQQSYGSSSHFSRGVIVNNTDDIFLTGAGSGTFDMGNYSTTLLGSYLVKIADNANIIEGKVFKDLNNDGLLDVTEIGIPNVILQLNNGPYVTSSNNLGNYNIYTISGNHSISIPNLPLYHTLSTPSVQNFNFTGMGNMDTSNLFGLYPVANMNDLKIDITPITNPKAGYVLTYLITYTNQGTTDQNALITLQASPIITYLGATPSPTLVAGQTITWDLGLLPAQANGTLFAQFNIPTSLIIGDLIQSNVIISPTANDQTPSNNTNQSLTAVVGPYDPNYKEVNIDTLYDIAGSDWLEYTIHFQNIGNDYAQNVILIDTMSSYLDLSFLELISKSHPVMNFSIKQGNVVEFRFDDILLPDSLSDPIGSNGFVKFRVKYLSTLPLFDSISNFADIYFDYNPAIRTDTAITYHSSHSLSLSKNFDADRFYVYPNPFDNSIRIKGIYEETKISILDLKGNSLLTKNLLNDEEIYLGNLSSAIYILKIETSNSLVIKRIVKN